MIKTIIKNTLLCLKYPFLYPRNVFSGLHYTNWKIFDWIREKKLKSTFTYLVNFSLDNENGVSEINLENGGKVYFELENNTTIKIIYRRKSEDIYERILDIIKTNSPIIDCFWNTSPGTIATLIINLQEKEKSNTLKVNTKIIHPIDFLLAKIVELYHITILQLFHCLPTFTYLDSIPEGWRKAFGKELCNEIRSCLIKEKKLFTGMRITQIKEKYGTLRIGGFYSRGISEILNKYSELSEKTCIICGKPATYISQGYICPYCDDHIEIKEFADKIKTDL